MAYSKKLTFLSSLLLLGGIVTGCDVDVEIGESETAASSMSASAGESAGESDPGETMDSGDTMDPGDDTTDPGETGPMNPDMGDGGDGGGGDECDLLLQDCPDGEGCYLDPAGEVACYPAGDPGVGEPCVDSIECAPGLGCVDDECSPLCDVADPAACGADVECVPLEGQMSVGSCTGGEPSCNELTEFLVNGLCASVCDPLVQDCVEGEKCLFAPGPEQFVCIPEGTGFGIQGDACEFLDSCELGFACIPGDRLPQAPVPGGCAAFCSLDGSISCDEPELQCAPWFEEGKVLPGAELVGVCSLPL